MSKEPRTLAEYGDRETEAARRVLIDLGQVLATYFADSIVVVGGWVPELLLSNQEDPHSGSIDVDVALNPDRLGHGRYAKIVEALLATRRYERTDESFKLRAVVDLRDDGPRVSVDVDFLKPPGKGRGKKGALRLPDFRPLDADGCDAAFRAPVLKRVEGRTIAGAENSVEILVASVADFLLMKSYALAKRDKPKDAYDICYSLEHAAGGMKALASEWRRRRGNKLVVKALAHLREKFKSTNSFGPKQVVEFVNPLSAEEGDRVARRAFELVEKFLDLVGGGR